MGGTIEARAALELKDAVRAEKERVHGAALAWYREVYGQKVGGTHEGFAP